MEITVKLDQDTGLMIDCDNEKELSYVIMLYYKNKLHFLKDTKKILDDKLHIELINDNNGKAKIKLKCDGKIIIYKVPFVDLNKKQKSENLIENIKSDKYEFETICAWNGIIVISGDKIFYFESEQEILRMFKDRMVDAIVDFEDDLGNKIREKVILDLETGIIFSCIDFSKYKILNVKYGDLKWIKNNIFVIQ